MAAVVVIGEMDVLLGRREEAVALLSRAQDAARAQADCLSFAFAEVVDGNGRFVVVEEWRSEAGARAHFASEPYLDYRERVEDLLAAPSVVRIHRVAETVHPRDPNPLKPSRAD
jgi:quinol monooxygenase YgiN